MRTARRTTPPALVELLFGRYRRRVLAFLLLAPDRSFYVREISRATRVPAGSLHRELTALAETGLLKREASGNQVRYQSDRSCPIFEELASIFRKTAGLADVLREALEPLGREVRASFVFGSAAQGKERPNSDVDVMVVGSVSFERVVEAMAIAAESLRREVNPVVMTMAAYRAKLKAKDRFATRVAREPKILIVGDPHELGEPA